MAVRIGRGVGSIALLAMGLLIGSSTAAARPDRMAIMTGGRFSYTTLRGDSLAILGARYGVEPKVIARLNNLTPTARLRVGQTLTIDNRHVIPEAITAPITINIPQRILFHTDAAGRVTAFPVGLGRPSWRTFLGKFSVARLETDPIWDVPKSIQEELRRAGKPVITRVLPGPDNPLDGYWIGLDQPSYGIHGTNAPASIYHFQTHGCIRMHPDDIERLFQTVRVGTPGEIIYERVLLAQDFDGTIWLEVHPDIYRRSADGLEIVRRLASHEELEGEMDWPAVQRALKTREGTPTDVTRRLEQSVKRSGP
jgi:L,D-transpeptidase ErfK/SrfK